MTPAPSELNKRLSGCNPTKYDVTNVRSEFSSG